MQILRTTNHVKWLKTKNGKCERGLILVQYAVLSFKKWTEGL